MPNAKRRTEIPFTNGFYLTRSRPFSSQRCINWYPNIPSVESLSPANLYPTPGLRLRVNELDGIGRGSYVFDGKLYVVCGHVLYRVDRSISPDGIESYSPVTIGTIDGDGPVIMAATRLQLCILSPGGECYIYTLLTGVLSSINGTANFQSPVVDVVAIDSYFMFAKQNSRIIFHSNLNDGLTYNALDQWQITQYPKVIGLMVYRNQLYAMGEYITVPFGNSSTLEFAFRPIPNAVIDSGLATETAKTLFRDSFVYLGSGENAERSVWLFNGYPQKISTEPIDYIIQNQISENITSAIIMRHSQNGAEFIVMTMGDWCFVYDLSSQRWHERRSRVPFGVDFIDSVWRVNSISQAYNRVFVTDSAEPIVGEIDDGTYTEYGVNQHRSCVLQPFTSGGAVTRVYGIEVNTDTGNTESDTLQLRWSDDGGFNFSDWISRGMGAVGQYGRRIFFDRLGAFTNSRTLEIKYTGSNQCAINKVSASL